MEDTSSISGFIELLQSASIRFYQEREIGLDIYLSGVWGILPAALAVVSATVFFLAIFHLIPRRRHSIPLLLAIGVTALGIGLFGSYWNYRQVGANPDGEAPRIFSEGPGAKPVTEGQKAALLCFPLFLGGAVLGESLGCAVFLLFFGGRDPEKGKRKKEGKEPEPEG